MSYTNFVENMSKYMKVNKMKQKAVANRTGMNKDKVSRIFRGESEPKISELEKIASALGKKISDFEDEIIISVKNSIVTQLPQPHFCMGEVTEQRKKDALVYSKFAERIHYLHSIANIQVMVEDEF
jgi:transcriptional regulator with XRE-family HTH domain